MEAATSDWMDGFRSIIAISWAHILAIGDVDNAVLVTACEAHVK